MPDDQPPEAAVIDLNAARVELEGTPIKRKRSFCYHRHVTVNLNQRTLTCRKCGADVDPYAFIEYLGSEWDRYTLPMESMRAEAAELEARLRETKRQERNARARLKRVQEKIDALMDEAGQ